MPGETGNTEQDFALDRRTDTKGGHVMYRRLTICTLLLMTAVYAAVVADSSAQQPSSAPASSEAPDEQEPARVELQSLYRALYELQMHLVRGSHSEAVAESLRTAREELLEQIAATAARAERERGSRDVIQPPPPRGGDLYGIVAELGKLGEQTDWEEIGRVIERNSGGLEEGLVGLAEQLKDLKVDIGPERVKIDAGNGSRFTFTIPEEVREELSAGMKELGRELSTMLDDSTRSEHQREWKALLDDLPAGVGARILGRPVPRQRTVVAESVFSTWKDFELAEDEAVRGDVVLIGGDAYIAGEVQGNVFVVGGDLILEGEAVVGGDAVSVGGQTEVEEGVRVNGRRFDLAAVAPGIEASLVGASGGLGWLLYTVRLLVLFALLMLAHALVGARLEVLVGHAKQSSGRALASGAIWYSAVFGIFVIAAAGLAVSVIGIPVVVVVIAGFIAVTLLAYFAGCEVVGQRFVALLGREFDGPRWQFALLGAALLELPAVIALGLSTSSSGESAAMLLNGLEFFVRFVTIALGFGAVVATRLGGRPAGWDGEHSSSLPVAPEA